MKAPNLESVNSCLYISKNSFNSDSVSFKSWTYTNKEEMEILMKLSKPYEKLRNTLYMSDAHKGEKIDYLTTF